jgi:hypothetical protein
MQLTRAIADLVLIVEIAPNVLNNQVMKEGVSMPSASIESYLAEIKAEDRSSLLDWHQFWQWLNRSNPQAQTSLQFRSFLLRPENRMHQNTSDSVNSFVGQIAMELGPGRFVG